VIAFKTDVHRCLAASIGAVAVLSAAGCGGKEEAAPEVARHGWGDAAPVVVVERTSGGARFTDEVEPNDEPGQAADLVPPAGIEGTFGTPGDADLFKVAVDRAGGLRAVLDAVPGVDTVVQILDAKGEVVVHGDNGGANVAEGLPNAPVEPGTYYVKVVEFVKKKPKAGDAEAAGKAARAPAPYRLTVTYAEPPGIGEEREPNGNPEDALPLAPGGSVEGYIGWRRDNDWWSVDPASMLSLEALDIDIASPKQVKLTVRVLDAKGNTVLVREARGRGQDLAVRGWKASGLHRILLSGRYSSHDRRYAISTRKRALEGDDEVEPNDAAGTANPLAVETGALDGKRSAHATVGDQDWFALPVGSASVGYNIDVSPSPGLDVDAAVVRADGTAIRESANAASGATEKLLSVPVGAGERLYLRVTPRPRGASAAADAVYTVRWSTTAYTTAPPPAPPAP